MYNGDFSLWCDFVERDFIDGEFRKLLKSEAINGATSNPSIFKNAILNSPAYTKQKEKFKHKTPKEIYEILATTDIRLAAEAMFKNFIDKDDGFISIEVDPSLSGDAKETYKEGKRLNATIGMPNVMIKIPATEAGFEAMEKLIAKGINVNATLIFSPKQTKECLKAFEKGTKKFKERFPKANLPQAVISIFVSRFDRLLDSEFEKVGIEKAKFGIVNASKCYHLIEDAKLENVRALFASTGVKGDDLEKDYYIKELMYKNSINTAPLETIKEFIKSKKMVKEAVSKGEVDKFFKKVENAGFNVKEIYSALLEDGLKQFEVAFGEILDSLK
ncbi:MAG: transaldolase [Campylobacteraceae bacterium]|nr:transaldolase [Campylobacteraceae bacterium]